MIEAKDRIRTDKSALVAALREAGADVRKESSFKCPFHEDKSPSCGIYQGDDGAWRVKCQAASCGFSGDVFDVRERATGKSVDDQLSELREVDAKPKKSPARTWPSIEAWENSFAHRVRTYRYTNPDTGAVDLLKCRIESPGEKKTFRQARVDASGTVHGEAPAHPHPLYNRTRVRSATEVIVVEGEKCVEAIQIGAGYVATTMATGAGPGKASLTDWTPLAGKTVYLWPDHDPADDHGLRAGHQFMREVAEKLRELSPPANVWWINPDLLGLGDKQDAADYLDRYAESKADAMSDALDIAVPLDGASQLRTYIEEITSGRRANQPLQSFPTLTAAARPLLPGCIVVIAGDPGATKSFLLLQILADLLLVNRTTASCFMLEDDRNFHVMRCLAQLTHNGNLTNEEWVREHQEEVRRLVNDRARDIEAITQSISEAPDDTLGYPQIAEWVSRAADRSRVVAVDPITAIDSGRDPWNSERQFMTKAKAALRRNRSSMVLITHPRSAQNRGTADDLAGSRAFGRFAQCVLWLKRYDDPLPVEVRAFGAPVSEQMSIDREIRIVKARNGIGQGWRIGLQFDSKTLRFRECGSIVRELSGGDE